MTKKQLFLNRGIIPNGDFDFYGDAFFSPRCHLGIFQQGTGSQPKKRQRLKATWNNLNERSECKAPSLPLLLGEGRGEGNNGSALQGRNRVMQGLLEVS